MALRRVERQLGRRPSDALRARRRGGTSNEVTIAGNTILINRAPVLTLWGAVVAERLGYGGDEALSLGKCLAGLNAQTKGRMLGIYGAKKEPKGLEKGKPKKVGLGEEFWVKICDRSLPCKNTADGVRAVVKDKPIDPGGVRKYLAGKFGEDLQAVRDAMAELAASHEPEELAGQARWLYEQFRPEIPRGKRGWGAKGELDLDFIRSLGAGG